MCQEMRMMRCSDCELLSDVVVADHHYHYYCRCWVWMMAVDVEDDDDYHYCDGQKPPDESRQHHDD